MMSKNWSRKWDPSGRRLQMFIDRRTWRCHRRHGGCPGPRPNPLRVKRAAWIQMFEKIEEICESLGVSYSLSSSR
jgi:hypothetical protein